MLTIDVKTDDDQRFSARATIEDALDLVRMVNVRVRIDGSVVVTRASQDPVAIAAALMKAWERQAYERRYLHGLA